MRTCSLFRSNLAWLLLTISVVGTGVATAQPTVLRWLVSVADADIIRDEPLASRIYDTPSEITLLFTLINRTGDSLVVTEENLQSEVHFSVISDQEPPLASTWDPEVWMAGDSRRTLVSRDTAITIDPSKGAEFRVTLRRADREPFSQGRHVIRISIPGGLRSARTAEGNLWTGRLTALDGTVSVVLGGPTNPRERGASYEQVGKRAAAQGRANDAIVAFQAAVAADPVNPIALISLGEAYLGLARFREATGPLEQALRLIPERSSVPAMLALAYVGLGDEPQAIAVLRRAGVAADKIPAEIQRLRTRVRR